MILRFWRPASWLALCLLVGLRMSESAIAAPYDYCQMFGGKAILVGFDRSDKWDAIDRGTVIEAAEKIFQDVPSGDRLVVFTITDDFATSEKSFDQCKPGCPDMSLFDQLLGTCREAIARRDMVQFRTSFAVALQKLLGVEEEHKGSAIVETLAARTDEYALQGVRKLILFSDLIQNTKLASLRKMDEASMQALLVTVQRESLLPSLKGAEVRVFGFARTDGRDKQGLSPEQLERLREFWVAYFEQGGATSAEVHQHMQ